MADACAQARDTAGAEHAYEQFQSFFPSSTLLPTVAFRLGLLHFQAADYMRAALEFTRVADDRAAGEVRAAARYNLALCQREIAGPDSARVALERYRQDYPDDARAADVALQLGDLAESGGRPEDALHELERALDARPRAALATEIQFRLGRVREQLGRPTAALAAYEAAAASADRDAPFRLSAVARCAALYEKRRDYPRAVAAYRDIVRNAKDRELVAAAADRVTQLESGTRRR